MLMFEDMLKVYSGPAAIFSNLSLQKRYFHKFYYFSDHVYFPFLTGLKLFAMASVNAWISREPFDRVD